jgi:hypothetical protein
VFCRRALVSFACSCSAGELAWGFWGWGAILPGQPTRGALGVGARAHVVKLSHAHTAHSLPHSTRHASAWLRARGRAWGLSRDISDDPTTQRQGGKPLDARLYFLRPAPERRAETKRMSLQSWTAENISHFIPVALLSFFITGNFTRSGPSPCADDGRRCVRRSGAGLGALHDPPSNCIFRIHDGWCTLLENDVLRSVACLERRSGGGEVSAGSGRWR